MILLWGKSNPKHSKQRVDDDVVGDDSVMGQLDYSGPIDKWCWDAPGQTPPSASLQVDAAAFGAMPGQTSPSASKLAPSRALGAAPAPKVLKAKKLNVKKSSL
jgi:hypothetical protein